MGSRRVGHDWVTFTLLLAIYFIFILDYRNEKKKSKFDQFFLFELKMGCITVETTQNINAYGPRIANKHTVQWWFKTFCKGEDSLEDEACSSLPSEVDNDQLRRIIKANLTTTREVTKEMNVSHSMVVWHLKQIGKVKKAWQTGVSWADWKFKKVVIWSVVFP